MGPSRVRRQSKRQVRRRGAEHAENTGANDKAAAARAGSGQVQVLVILTCVRENGASSSWRWPLCTGTQEASGRILSGRSEVFSSAGSCPARVSTVAWLPE